MARFTFALFSAHSKLLVAISQRSDGTMTTAGDTARKAAVQRNRDLFLQGLDLDPGRVVSARQVHGNRVTVVSAKDRGRRIADADGLLTATPQTFLAVTVADCLPVFFYDPTRRAVGMLHAGWRSLAGGIIGGAVARLNESFRTQPERLLVGVGPAIGPCHYAVGAEVAAGFSVFAAAMVQRENSVFLDLKQVACAQLKTVGVRPEHI